MRDQGRVRVPVGLQLFGPDTLTWRHGPLRKSGPKSAGSAVARRGDRRISHDEPRSLSDRPTSSLDAARRRRLRDHARSVLRPCRLFTCALYIVIGDDPTGAASPSVELLVPGGDARHSCLRLSRFSATRRSARPMESNSATKGAGGFHPARPGRGFEIAQGRPAQSHPLHGTVGTRAARRLWRASLRVAFGRRSRNSPSA